MLQLFTPICVVLKVGETLTAGSHIPKAVFAITVAAPT
jgi:hypothetical protein